MLTRQPVDACRCQEWIREVFPFAGDVLEGMAILPWSFRFSLRAGMWRPQRLPVKDMILKRNEGAEGGEVKSTGESMPRLDLCSTTFYKFL